MVSQKTEKLVDGASFGFRRIVALTSVLALLVGAYEFKTMESGREFFSAIQGELMAVSGVACLLSALLIARLGRLGKRQRLTGTALIALSYVGCLAHCWGAWLLGENHPPFELYTAVSLLSGAHLMLVFAAALVFLGSYLTEEPPKETVDS